MYWRCSKEAHNRVMRCSEEAHRRLGRHQMQALHTRAHNVIYIQVVLDRLEILLHYKMKPIGHTILVLDGTNLSFNLTSKIRYNHPSSLILSIHVFSASVWPHTLTPYTTHHIHTHIHMCEKMQFKDSATQDCIIVQRIGIGYCI
jgi:hypothetical protein